MFKENDKWKSFNNLFSFFKQIHRYSDSPDALLRYVGEFAQWYYSLEKVQFVDAHETPSQKASGQIYPIHEDDDHVIGYFKVERARDDVKHAKSYKPLDDFFSVATILIENAFLKTKEKRLLSEIIDIQLRLLDARTKGGEMHSKNVQSLGLSIAGKLGLSLKEMIG